MSIFSLLDIKSLLLPQLHHHGDVESWELPCRLGSEAGPAQQCYVPKPEDDSREQDAGRRDPDRRGEGTQGPSGLIPWDPI